MSTYWRLRVDISQANVQIKKIDLNGTKVD